MLTDHDRTDPEIAANNNRGLDYQLIVDGCIQYQRAVGIIGTTELVLALFCSLAAV